MNPATDEQLMSQFRDGGNDAFHELFGRYKDKDLIDLAAEASMAALDDGGVTMADMGILASGNLNQANAMVGQRLQKGPVRLQS